MKNKYYSNVSKKLLGLSASPKSYWSILKTFLNSKKIIVPIFHENKAEIFNSHFSKQCTLINNNSKTLFECLGKSNESLSFITFEKNDIEKNN